MFHIVDKSCLPFLACLTIEHSVREGQTYRTSEQALHLCIGTYGHPARLQNNNQREVRCCVTQAAHTHTCHHSLLLNFRLLEKKCEYMLNLLKEPYSSQVSNLSLLKVKHYHHRALLRCQKDLVLRMILNSAYQDMMMLSSG